MTKHFLKPKPEVKTEFNYRFPACEQFQLDQLDVQLFHLPGRYVATIFLVLAVGLDEEPVPGLSALTLNVCDEGTLSHPGASLAEALEDCGAEFDSIVTETSVMAGVSMPVSRLRPALDLLVEIITEPSFEPSDVRRMQKLRQTEIDQVRANSAASANRALQMALFDRKDRHWTPDGGLSDPIARLEPEQVKQFHQDFFATSKATLVIAGDLPAEITRWVADRFSNHEGFGGRAQVSSATSFNPTRRVWVVDRPNATQADLRIGGPAVERTDPNYPALRTASSVVGGSFLSRLNRVLREERGYTYGANFNVSPLLNAGVYRMSGSFRHEVAGVATAEALRLMNIAAEPITEQELLNAKNYMLGVAPIHFDTAESIAFQAAVLASVGIGPEYIDQLHAAIQDVSVEDANRVFTEIVRPENSHIVVCGQAEDLLNQLSAQDIEAEIVELVL